MGKTKALKGGGGGEKGSKTGKVNENMLGPAITKFLEAGYFTAFI